MATSFQKPVKDFLSKFQKDLDALQQTIKKEGDDLVKKVKHAANKDSINSKKEHLELLVEAKLRKFEPAINKFMHELNTNAKKAGVDLTQLEKTVRSGIDGARTRLSQAGDTVKARAKKTKAKGTAAKAKPAGTVKKAGTAKKAGSTAKAAQSVKAPKTTAVKAEPAAADADAAGVTAND